MEHKNIEALQAFIKLQALLHSKGLKATNKTAVKKEIKKKDSSEPQKKLWSSWCTDGKNNFLAILDGGNLKLISKEQMEGYNIRSIK